MQAVVDRLGRGTDNISPFAIAWEDDLKVSYTTVDTIALRDSIEEWRRKAYMLVYVVATDITYRLGANITLAGQVWVIEDFGVPTGVVTEAQLFTGGYIKPQYIQNVFLNDSFVVATEAAMLALVTKTGNFVIRTDTNVVYVKLNNANPSVLADFTTTSNSSVLSVNGAVGAVTVSITGLIDLDPTGFNTKVAATATIATINTNIASLTTTTNGNSTSINSLNTTMSSKANLVSGTVPLGELPYVFSNGITPTVNAIKLGGVLTGATTIDGVSLYDFNYLNILNFSITAKTTLNLIWTDGTNTFTVTGTSLAGLRYTTDLSATFTTNSLITKKYVDDRVTNVASGNPFNDNVAIIKNVTDPTKLIQFSAALITTATTRIYTFPNVAGTIALTSDLSTASDGLIKTGNNITLGGPLIVTKDIIITGTSSNILLRIMGSQTTFSPWGLYFADDVLSTSGFVSMSNGSSSFAANWAPTIANRSFIFTDNGAAKKGIQYAATGYETTDSSLISRGYANTSYWKTIGSNILTGTTEIYPNIDNSYILWLGTNPARTLKISSIFMEAKGAINIDAIAEINIFCGLPAGNITNILIQPQLFTLGTKEIRFSAGGNNNGVVAYTFSGATLTNMPATFEYQDVFFSFSANMQFNTGAIATQRTINITARTYSFVAASTITDASTLYIVNAPLAGQLATITNAYAFNVNAGGIRFGELAQDDTLVQILVRHATTFKLFWRASTTLGAGGGITNTAVLNEIMKSNAPNAVPSGLFSSTLGNLDLGGATTVGNARLVTVFGSDLNIDLTFAAKGAGVMNFNAALLQMNSQAIFAYTTSIGNTVATALVINRNTTVAPAIGIGAGMSFETKTATNVFKVGSTIESISTNIATGAEAFDLSLKSMYAGVINSKLLIKSYGAVDFLGSYTLVAGVGHSVNYSYAINGGAIATHATLNYANSFTYGINGQAYYAAFINPTVTVGAFTGTKTFGIYYFASGTPSADHYGLIIANGRTGLGTVVPTRRLDVVETDGTNGVVYAQRLIHLTSLVPAAGIGVGLEFVTEVAAGGDAVVIGATIEAVSTNLTGAAESFDIVLKLRTAGVAVAEKFRLTSAGNITLVGTGTAVDWVATSDRRLKKNINRLNPEEYFNNFNKIIAISQIVSNYDRIDTGKHELGFIAQELEEIASEYVSGAYDNNKEWTLSVNYAKMIVPLYKGIEYVNKEVIGLRERVKKLEDKLIKHGITD